MTRVARSGSTQKHRKMPEDATEWSELSSQFQDVSSKTKKLNNAKKKKLQKNNFDNSSFEKKATEENSDISESLSSLQTKKLKNKKKNIKDDKISDQLKSSNKFLQAKKFLNDEGNQELDHKKISDEAKKLKKNRKVLKRKRISHEETNEFESSTNFSIKKLKKNTDKKSDNNNQIMDTSGSNQKIKKLKKKRSLKTLEGNQDLSQEKNLNEIHEHSNSLEIKKSIGKKKFKNLVDNASENEYNHNDSKSPNKGPVKIPLSSISLTAKEEQHLNSAKHIMQKKNVPGKTIKKFISNAKRMAKKDKQKILSKICFNCRKVGHLVAKCPLNPQANCDICFKCGSKEHISFKCYSNVKGYPFAKCFICQEKGHITRECPQNTRGVYPNGGSCNFCGSINHFQRECPVKNIKGKERAAEQTLPFVSFVKEGTSADAEDFS